MFRLSNNAYDNAYNLVHGEMQCAQDPYWAASSESSDDEEDEDEAAGGTLVVSSRKVFARQVRVHVDSLLRILRESGGTTLVVTSPPSMRFRMDLEDAEFRPVRDKVDSFTQSVLEELALRVHRMEPTIVEREEGAPVPVEVIDVSNITLYEHWVEPITIIRWLKVVRVAEGQLAESDLVELEGAISDYKNDLAEVRAGDKVVLPRPKHTVDTIMKATHGTKRRRCGPKGQQLA